MSLLDNQHAAAGTKAKPFGRIQVDAAFEQLRQQLRLGEACWVASPPDASPALLSAGPSLQDCTAELDCGALLGPPSSPTPIQLMHGSAMHVPPGAQPPPAPSLQYEPWPGTVAPSLPSSLFLQKYLTLSPIGADAWPRSHFAVDMFSRTPVCAASIPSCFRPVKVSVAASLNL